LGVDIIGHHYYDNNSMEVEKSGRSDYYLIDWREIRRAPLLCLYEPKVIRITKSEAHNLNQNFMLNNISKRYILK
jgi:hypothetical protein